MSFCGGKPGSVRVGRYEWPVEHDCVYVCDTGRRAVISAALEVLERCEIGGPELKYVREDIVQMHRYELGPAIGITANDLKQLEGRRGAVPLAVVVAVRSIVAELLSESYEYQV